MFVVFVFDNLRFNYMQKLKFESHLKAYIHILKNEIPLNSYFYS